MPIRLYHPKTGHEYEAANEAQAAVMAESGWLPAPEPEEPEPGRAAEPVTYEPVIPKPAKRATKLTTKSTD